MTCSPSSMAKGNARTVMPIAATTSTSSARPGGVSRKFTFVGSTPL
jgi:hypothetical protein